MVNQFINIQVIQYLNRASAEYSYLTTHHQAEVDELGIELPILELVFIVWQTKKVLVRSLTMFKQMLKTVHLFKLHTFCNSKLRKNINIHTALGMLCGTLLMFVSLWPYKCQ